VQSGCLYVKWLARRSLNGFRRALDKRRMY